jgi:MOSC domain-containing protein YiiM
MDPLALPVGSVLRIGSAILAMTGLRNPCRQLDDVHDGLMRALLDRAPDGSLIRKGGVMAVVVASGVARSGDAIDVALPPPPLRPMDVV